MKKLLTLLMCLSFQIINTSWIHYSDLTASENYKNMDISQLQSEKQLISDKLKSMSEVSPMPFAQDRHNSRIVELKSNLEELSKLIQEKSK